MRVVEYLKGIEHCLDMDLENEWGVSPLGNFVILAEEGERRKLWDYVHNSGSYHFLEKIRSNGRGQCHVFNHAEQPVELQFHDFVAPMYTTNCGCKSNVEAQRHSHRQLLQYDVMLMLHPLSYNVQEATPRQARCIARVISQIAWFGIHNDVSLCLPRAVGEKYKNPFDCSRIPYHQPESKIISLEYRV